ncbi:hypothetical protein G6F65_020803 [Rhizopus arrhizus]|nr:hypothetical protein G6F65_020803 [Rhizopus arrhizus]
MGRPGGGAWGCNVAPPPGGWRCDAEFTAPRLGAAITWKLAVGGQSEFHPRGTGPGSCAAATGAQGRSGSGGARPE